VRKKFPQEPDVGWVRVCRFRWRMTKNMTRHLASYTIIGNNWSLGEIKIAGRDMTIKIFYWVRGF